MVSDLKVSILVLSMNSLSDLKECLPSIIDQDYPNLKVCLIDNASTDNSVNYIKENFPEVEVDVLKENLGYSGAYNLGLKKAFDEGSDLCLLLNSDVILENNCVTNLVFTFNDKTRRKEHKVGLIQPVILLDEERDKVNTIGNAIHYLGYGYCENYKDPYKPIEKDINIISPSGAALLISKDYFQQVGFLDEDFFMYNEDQNYAWRGLLLGYKHYLSAKSVIYHKYIFKSHDFKFYHSEKNRLLMFFENYSLSTVLILFPILILNELLILVYAILSGWGKNKVRSWKYIVTHIGKIKEVRKKVQNSRLVSDREIYQLFRHQFMFAPVDSFIVKYLVNPLFSLYYKFAKLLIV